MRQFDIHDERKNTHFAPRFLDKLIYLPGAVIMLYGLWLALTV